MAKKKKSTKKKMPMKPMMTEAARRNMMRGMKMPKSMMGEVKAKSTKRKSRRKKRKGK